MNHNSFIHSSVDGHLGCSHVLAIVNSAAMNKGIHVNFSILVPSGYMTRTGISGSYNVVVVVFSYNGFIPNCFKGIFIPSSIVAVSIYIPTNSQEHSLFSTLSSQFIACSLLDDGHSDWCEVISHCSFDLHFSNNERC